MGKADDDASVVLLIYIVYQGCGRQVEREWKGEEEGGRGEGNRRKAEVRGTEGGRRVVEGNKEGE